MKIIYCFGNKLCFTTFARSMNKSSKENLNSKGE